MHITFMYCFPPNVEADRNCGIKDTWKKNEYELFKANTWTYYTLVMLETEVASGSERMLGR